MTYEPNILCRSLADSDAAQNSHQSMMGSQTTQSLDAYTRQTYWQAATPTCTSSTHEETGPKETPSATEPCPFADCKVRCGRPQEMERHIREYHLPYDIYCEQPGCDWTGNRRYALRNHLTHKHAGVPIPEVFMIYDAKRLVKQLLNKEIDVEKAVGEAQFLFQTKAVQLGKLGIRRWMKGFKGRAAH
jgi:hypothetical protein